MRLAVLVTHPVQYFAPVFRHLAQQKDLQLKVFFGCDHGFVPREDPDFKLVFKWDCQPTDGFEHEFFSTGSVDELEGLTGIRLAFKAKEAISRYQPDAVLIFAYSPAFITASTLLLHLAGYKLLLRADTTDHALARSYFKDKVRQVLLTLYYRQFTHFFPVGTNSINHYRKMGVSKDRMTLVYFPIDTDFFQKQVDFWLPQRDYLRTVAGIKPDDSVLMYCGKMSRAKNPLLIPDALAILSPEKREKIWLLAVGDGELRQKFEQMAKAQLGKRAIFAGFKNQSKLGQYYAMSDTLILPSQSGETWGLVVNEALQFGLKVIVSDKVGSGKDLLKDNDRSLIFTSGDATALASSISQLIIQNYSPRVDFDRLPHPKQLAQSVYLNLQNK